MARFEPHMDRVEVACRDKVLLAAVKRDANDIGKNFVDIILSNNGMEVISLGINVPSGQLIQAECEHRPDLLGVT